MSLTMLTNVQVPTTYDCPVPRSAQEHEEDERLFERAKEVIKEHKALLIAHYYTDPVIQRLAEETGGLIGDSLEMARFGKESDLQTLIVAGVRFMGESAKILSPEKTVLMPDLKSECSLDLSCPVDQLAKVKAEHKDVTIVSYANTSAQVKALSDWIVTSSTAVDLANYLKGRGEKILWVPDRHLGSYIANKTDANILSWPGSCVVHDSFAAKDIQKMKEEHPQAKLLVHPESPASVVALADCVGSTSQLLAYAIEDSAQEYIVATERGIFYKMQQACPDKTFIEAAMEPRNQSMCINCAKCPWMDMNSVKKIIDCLEGNKAEHEVEVSAEVREGALKPLNRLLAFAAAKKAGNIPNDL